MEKLSDNLPQINFKGAKSDFSSDVQRDWHQFTERPSGESIKLLIGGELAGYFPKRIEAAGNFVAMKSEFGTGHCLFGTHDKIFVQNAVLTQEVQMIREHGIQVSVVEINKLEVQKDFMFGEDLSVEVPRIEKGINFDEMKNCFNVEDPYVDDPFKLSNNLGQAIKIAESEKIKIRKEGLQICEMYEDLDPVADSKLNEECSVDEECYVRGMFEKCYVRGMFEKCYVRGMFN